MTRLRFLVALLAIVAVCGSAWAYSGAYDVGGGANDFASPQAAVAALVSGGMTGPVTLNVYSGVYSGTVLVSAITGLGAANPLVIQNAPGQSPIIENTASSGKGIQISAGGYITIRGFEVRNCANPMYIVGTTTAYLDHITIQNNYIHHGSGFTGTGADLFIRYVNYATVIGNRINVESVNANQGIYVLSVFYSVFSNNMIAGTTRSTAYALADEGQSNNNAWYFNTFCGYETIAAYQLTPTAATDVHIFKNNICYATRSASAIHNAIYVNLAATYNYPIESDYNVVYANPSGGAPFGVDGYNKSLAEWQALTGEDMHSVVFNPGLVSTTPPFDLHLAAGLGSVADNIGTPIAGMTEDYDGQSRDGTNPDIGADERALVPGDVFITPVAVSPSLVCSGSGATFAFDYLSRSNTAPVVPALYVNGALYAGMSDPGGDYTKGVHLTTVQALPAGAYSYHFEVSGLRLPAVSGEYNGPKVLLRHGTLDVGGGNMDFTTIAEAVAFLKTCGMDGHVVLNIFGGTYAHSGTNDLTISSLSTQTTAYISGLGTYNLTFRAAPGQTPVIAPVGTSTRAFALVAANNVTVEGLTIVCGTGQPININYSGVIYPTDVIIRNNKITWTGTSSTPAIYAGYTQNLLIEGNTVTTTGAAGVGITLQRTMLPATVRNNAIYSPASTYYGVYHQGATATDAMEYWYNNSISMGATGSTCFMFTNLYRNFVLKNNIFYQAGSGATAACLKTTTTTWACPVTSDYNIYWSNGSCATNSSASVAYSYAAYRALCSSVEQHSQNCNPGFVDNALHIATTSCANGTGTPVSGVTLDRDGEIRSLSTPDVGADEVRALITPQLVHVGDHFCLRLAPGQESMIYWCGPLDDQPYFSWVPGCNVPGGCSETCVPYTGQATWTAHHDSVGTSGLWCNWWSARFTGLDDGCICVYFEYQLSVELSSFSATAGDGRVDLAWATASETDNDRFIVYRGLGDEWSQIGQVTGHGTVTTVQHYQFPDEDVTNGRSYQYRLATVTAAGSQTWIGSEVSATPAAANVLPTEYALHQNYPNPFNPATMIAFDLVEAGFVRLTVYNVMGQKITNLVSKTMTAGRHQVQFDASALPSGLYFCQLAVNGFVAEQKMLLMK